MSKYIVEFVMRRSMEIQANGLVDAHEQAFTWINHEEFREEHNLRDLGFSVTSIRLMVGTDMDVGPRQDT